MLKTFTRLRLQATLAVAVGLQDADIGCGHHEEGTSKAGGDHEEGVGRGGGPVAEAERLSGQVDVYTPAVERWRGQHG